MTNRKELYGGMDDLNPDEPRGQVRITGREYLGHQEFGSLRHSEAQIIGCGFYEYLSSLQRKGTIKPWGASTENVGLEVWRKEERALFDVFVIELQRECGIALTKKGIEDSWEYYQDM